MMKWRNAKLTKNFSELLDSQEEDLWLINYEIYELNTKISASQVLAQKGKQKNNWTTEQIVPEEYHKYLSLFDKKKSKQFPPTRTWDHKIEMKLTFKPKAFKPYKLFSAEIKEQEKFIEENLWKGYIKYSKSPMALLFFFVVKKNRKLWLCQDYYYPNEYIIKNTYPIPNIQTILDKLCRSKYFTTIYIWLEYNNIHIRKQDQWKGTFRRNQGLFEPTVMFFRMCNSPAIFQMMMNTIFAPLIAKNLILVYMDDILIHTPTKKQLYKTMKEVLKIL